MLDAGLPRAPVGSPLAVRIRPAAERAVRDGHPWVFEDSIRSISREGKAGDIAVIFDRKDRFLAVGLHDPHSPIRVRVLASGSPAKVGGALFRDRFGEALSLRTELLADPGTSGIRMLSGEGDRMPGLVADQYGDGLVLKSYTPAWIPWLGTLVPELQEMTGAGTVVHLPSTAVADAPVPDSLREPVVLDGEPPDDGFEFLESGLRFRAHPVVGHKTGFYLDQRDNRARVRSLAGGRRVLNVFAYTGGFSLAAAAGGASGALDVDQSEAALEQARRHFKLNRTLEPVRRARHATRVGDAFEVLQELADAGERFGLVVVDPPSFARHQGQVEGAIRAYARLTRMTLAVLEPGGILVQASCTARVAADEFFGTVLNTARSEGRPLDEIERTGHPVDHPVRHPEGEYLKCLFARTP